MNRTYTAVQNLLQSLGADAYDLGVLSARGMLPGLSGLMQPAVLSRIGMLCAHNARGAHIYIRPTGSHRFTLLDDLDCTSLVRLSVEGFEPAAVVETSPGNFQAWLKHPTELSPALSTLAAQTLARRFGADPGAADWRHFGRLPGFTNRKVKHRMPDGWFPFVLLRSHTGRQFSMAQSFRVTIEEEQASREQQCKAQTHTRHRSLSPQRGERISPLSLQRFRDLPAYAGRPAQADIAFCSAAHSAGMPEQAIADALERDYLSRDLDPGKRDRYIGRTITNAREWSERTGHQQVG